jgi:anti-anti-sigma regulatory factor
VKLPGIRGCASQDLRIVRRKAFVAGSPQANTALRSLTWQGECCVDGIGDRKSELADALQAGSDIALDLSALSRIDTAGLQLLAAFVLALGQHGHVVHWRGVSNIVIEGARVMGLGGLLGLPPAAADTAPDRTGG